MRPKNGKKNIKINIESKIMLHVRNTCCFHVCTEESRKLIMYT